MRRERSPDREPLAPREAEVLVSVIRQHIRTGEPVGSRTVCREGRLHLAPASIRGIMGRLEEQGLLSQPHTSAGRIPTDGAYRLFVDRLIPEPRMEVDEAERIDRALSRSGGEVAALLEEASRQLSDLSNQVGLVLAPDFHRTVIERLEFVRLSQRRVMAILVGRSGVVHNRMLHVDEEFEQTELERIGSYLSESFGGCTLPEMRAALLRRLSEDRAAYDRLVARGLDLGRRTVEAGGASGEVFVEGASNLLGAPEFADMERAQALLRTLEKKGRLVDLLGRVLESSGVQVLIGEENPVAALADCSLVATSYGTHGNVIGSLGIVGPTRMEYSRVIALVDYLARLLSRLLSERDPDD